MPPQHQSPVMNAESIAVVSSRRGLYGEASLNEVLYLHEMGFRVIENLEAYTSVLSLWLNGNIIGRIENLDHFSKLTCLYLHDNWITRIENLHKLDKLQVLNMSRNRLESLDGIEVCSLLENLELEKNKIEHVHHLQSLIHCKQLTLLDLSYNYIEDPNIVDVLSQLTQLSVLNLKGNPITKTMKNYRKTIISKIPSLNHLDDKQVTPDEKRCAIAWSVGGSEAESRERQLIIEETEAKKQKDMQDWMEKQQQKKMEQNVKYSIKE